jgi:glucose dehydrogenase
VGESNITINLSEIKWGGMDSIDLACDESRWRAFMNTVMNRHVPQSVGKFLSSCATGGSVEGHSSMELVELRCYGYNSAPRMHVRMNIIGKEIQFEVE